MSKEQQGQQNKSQKAQKPKQQPKPKPLAPVEAPPEHVWEAPIPGPEILRQALGDPSQMTPDMLRQLQRTMGNEFTQQYVHNNVPEALARVQALSKPHQQTQRDRDEDSGGDLNESLATYPMAAEMGIVPPVANSVQRATDPLAGQDVGGSVESDIDSKKGGGESLPDDTRDHMEGAMGTDFSDVRVHTDSDSNQLNESLNAKAFTTGSDIFFSEGEYNPGSQSGQKLLAHELTHVVQQGASQPKPNTQRTTDEEEVEADADAETSSEESVGEEVGAATDAAMETVSEATADVSLKAKDKSGHPNETKPGQSRILQTKSRSDQQDERQESGAEPLNLAPPSPASQGMSSPEKSGPQKGLMRQEQGVGRPAAKRPTLSPTEFRHNLQRLVQRTQAHQSTSGKGIRMTQPDDRYEREADQFAETAVSPPTATPTTDSTTSEGTRTPPVARQSVTPMPQQILARKPLSVDQSVLQKHISRSLQDNFKNPKQIKRASIPGTVQRVTDDAVQLAHDQLNDPAKRDKEVQREISRKKGNGKPLSGAARRQMEGAFDADFSNVRVHNDPDSHKLARSVNAEAFATGSDIFFGEGAYTPASTSGQKLLAHELTHVMQQGSAPPAQKKEKEADAPRPTPASSPKSGVVQPSMRVSHPDDKYEKEADAVAEAAVQRMPQLKKQRQQNGRVPHLQRDDDEATMVKPGGETKENLPESGGGDNSPAKDKVAEQTDNKKASGAAEGASKDAKNTTDKSGGKAKSKGEQNAAAAKGNKGKHGGGGNAQKSEEQTLPNDAVANLQQQPPSVQDASTTDAKLANVAVASEKMPDVTPENVLPNWGDLAAGTVQLKKKSKKEKQKEKQKEIVGKSQQKNQSKKDKTKEKKEVKPPAQKDKGKKMAEKGKGIGGTPEGAEKQVAVVKQPEPKPLPPPPPEKPKPSEAGGVTPLGSPPSVDAAAIGQEVAWMQSPRMTQISKIVSEGVLDQKIQEAQQEGAQKAQRKPADNSGGSIQRATSNLSVPNAPNGFMRSESGLYTPQTPTPTASQPDIVVPHGPMMSNAFTAGLNDQVISRVMDKDNAPLSLGEMAGNVGGAASGGLVQRADDGGADPMSAFGFLGPDMAAMFAGGGGAGALMDGGPDMDMGAALSQAGGGGMAEGMMSNGASDVLSSVGGNTLANAANLPMPDANFAAKAAEQYSPKAFFDQTVGGLGDSAAAVGDSFASISSEATVWGKIAATMEALGTVIDLISQILDIVSLVLTIIDILCTVMIALAPLTIVVVLVPIFPFIWTPGVFSPIKAGVATVSRILDKVADVLGIIADVLMFGASVFRILDMLETLANPKPSEERQAAMDEHVNAFADETTAVFSNTMSDHAAQAAAGRQGIMDNQKQRMAQRKQNSNGAGGAAPPEPPMGLPPLPPEAAPGSFDDYGDASGDLAAEEQALMMQQEEIDNLMETGQAGMESIQSARETGQANKEGVDSHKKDMKKKKGKQQQMKKKTSGGKGKMGKGKAKGGKGKALMGIVMPLLMPIMTFAMMWGAGGDAETDDAKDGAGESATKTDHFNSANEGSDKLSDQRMQKTDQLMGQADQTNEKLGGLDSFLGERFDLGMQTMGMLQQDSGLITDQLSMVQQDRQLMMNQQQQSAGAATTWMESARQSREGMFMQLEQGLGTIGEAKGVEK